MDNYCTGGRVSDEFALMDGARLCRVCGLLYFGGISLVGVVCGEGMKWKG